MPRDANGLVKINGHNTGLHGVPVFVLV